MPERDALSEWIRDVVGIPDRLIKSLKTDDDWTFIIKVHGLLEAMLNQMLTNELGNPALSTFVSRLPTANDRSGKLAIATACNLLSKNNCAFIRAVSVLRNKFVHNIKNLDLRIAEYGATVTGNDGRDWRNGLKSGFLGLSEIGGVPIDEFIKNDPKTAIKVTLFTIMRDAFRHHQRQARPSPAPATPRK